MDNYRKDNNGRNIKIVGDAKPIKKVTQGVLFDSNGKVENYDSEFPYTVFKTTKSNVENKDDFICEKYQPANKKIKLNKKVNKNDAMQNSLAKDGMEQIQFEEPKEYNPITTRKQTFPKRIRLTKRVNTNTEMSQSDKDKFISFNDDTKLEVIENLINSIEDSKRTELRMKNMVSEMNELKNQMISSLNKRKAEDIKKAKQQAIEDIEYDKIINRDKEGVKKLGVTSERLAQIKQATFPMFDGLQTTDFSDYVLRNQLKEILEQKRIKQKDLAEKLDITSATMSNIINNRNSTSIELGFKIAITLRLRFTDIFYYDKEEYNEDYYNKK